MAKAPTDVIKLDGRLYRGFALGIPNEQYT
jgi:hypothetical protein